MNARRQFKDAFARYLFADSAPDVTPSLPKEAEHASVTLPLRPAPPGVTRGTSADAGCDGVTAETWEAAWPPRDWKQETVLSEFTAMLVQERMNGFIDDRGQLDLTEAERAWPEGLPLDYVAERAKEKLPYADQGFRLSTCRSVCRQLVERGDLVLRGGFLLMPSG